MRYQPIDPKLFITNRRRLREKLKDGEVVALHSGIHIQRSLRSEFPFRINSNFFWATGIDQPDTVLILTNNKETLFVPVRDEFRTLWDGAVLPAGEVSRLSGISDVSSADELKAQIPELKKAKVYGDSTSQLLTNVYSELFTGVKFEDAKPLLGELRTLKQPAEIELIKQACEITKNGFAEATKLIKPGAYEYEIEAELSRQYFRQRANDHAFLPIVASREATCTIHYRANDKVMQDGDLVLIDSGAEYANYASDVTRVYPVNGKFTPRQRAVYEAVLRVQSSAIKLLIPGTYIRDYERRVGEQMSEELVSLGLLTKEEAIIKEGEMPAYRRYYNTATSHFIGLDVHDAGNLREAVFAPNMVFSCEPGIYIPEERIGIRLEDDILITEKGPVNLTAGIPIDPDEVEAQVVE